MRPTRGAAVSKPEWSKPSTLDSHARSLVCCTQNRPIVEPFFRALHERHRQQQGSRSTPRVRSHFALPAIDLEEESEVCDAF